MPRAPKIKLSHLEVLKRLKGAGLEGAKQIAVQAEDNPMAALPERVQLLLGLLKNAKHKAQEMTFFVMYDIENNKVRNYIAKYLQRKGCVRVQKSIFVANLDRPLFNEIHQTLREVQQIYDNHDSILLVPISSDELRSIKLIGENLDFEWITDDQRTLFF